MQNKILIIEDDVNVIELLEIHFEDLDYDFASATDGESGLKMALRDKYSLIILDIMLPKLDGWEVCKRIRANNNLTPILMLTARTDEIDKVLGLELGADDYLTKPFSIRELIARVKAILRRTNVSKEPKQEEKTLKFGSLEIDMGKRTVKLENNLLELTTREFDLLKVFAENPGKAYSRQELLDLIWGYQFDGYEHTVNSHINRLRSKIEIDPAEPIFIKTVWGFGYRFSEKQEFTK